MKITGNGNISLVSWHEGHFHNLYPLANSPKIARNLRDSYPQPYTIHDARFWIEHNQKFNPPQNFAIEYKDQLVGSIGCEIGKNELRTNLELVFWVGEAYWGKGIATEAVRLYTDYAFTRFLEIERIFAQVYDFNSACMKVLENAGYVPEAILRNGFIKDGKVGDLFQYVKIRDEMK